MHDPIARSSLFTRASWGVVLTVVTAASALAFSCATPFPALGALGALFLPRREVFILVGINWLANQAIGFGLLHYPHDWQCYRGGLAMGVAAATCSGAALMARRVLHGAPPAVRALGSFSTAFAVFESVLFVLSPAGSGGDFAWRIVLWLLCINGIAFAAVLCLRCLLMAEKRMPPWWARYARRQRSSSTPVVWRAGIPAREAFRR